MAINQHYLDFQETIAAQASAVGNSLRSIVRVTGPKTQELVKKIFVADTHDWQNHSNIPRRYTGYLITTKVKQQLPVTLYWWPTGKSFTGQPLAELHLIGSPPIINLVLSEIYAQRVRPATPGEFTLRAFLSGKLDLVQAEAVLGVIDARTDQELDRALSQLAGGISNRLKDLRSDLLNDLADLEAGLDFVDEDLEFISRQALKDRLELGIKLARELLLVSSQRITSCSLPKVVLAGLPNAGKSTLFNLLAEKSEAIVSPIKGTTRDYLTALTTVNGLQIQLIDTAGIDEFTSGADQTGQALGHTQIQEANLILWCQACDLDEDEKLLNEQHLAELKQEAQKLIVVKTKVDLLQGELPNENIGISTINLTGISILRELIHRELTTGQQEQSVLISSTAARCQDALEKTIEALTRANSWMSSSFGDEMIALEIRTALETLGEITGEVYTNDLLDRIFSRFCIGK